jgi:hypothetical protein
MVYIQVLRNALAHWPITAGSPFPLFYLKAGPDYEELYVFQPEKAMFKIPVMTKAWKCPNFGSGHGQLLAVGTRNLLDSGTRRLLALETGQLLALGNRQLSASGTTELLAYGKDSGLRDQLLASGIS